MKLNLMVEPDDYSRMLDAAKDVDSLRAGLEEWMPFVSDAIDQLQDMDFSEFKRGLASERRGKFAGDEWADRFGAILLPRLLIRADEIARKFGAPLGVALLRMEDHGLENF